jgi:hypothetical protein
MFKYIINIEQFIDSLELCKFFIPYSTERNTNYKSGDELHLKKNNGTLAAYISTTTTPPLVINNTQLLLNNTQLFFKEMILDQLYHRQNIINRIN